MKTYIHHIETLVPPYTYRQNYARDRMIEWLPGKRNRRLIRGIYDHSGIATRYSVLPDFEPGAEPVLFNSDESGHVVEPSTGTRNTCFAEWSRRLSVEVAANAISHAPGFIPPDVTHVITVSCTGFYNPGPELEIVKGLALDGGVERYHLGFMGCYGAFPAMRMARQFCAADPGAVVLVVCLELCTLHLQFREDPDSLLANALFADGAAAVLISSRPPVPEAPALCLQAFSSSHLPEGARDMAWSIGDHGFDLKLSTYVPGLLAGSIGSIVDRTLAASSWSREDIRLWAVHPGGRAILDRIETELALARDQLTDARSVLRDYGNMSSATILFVLRRMLDRGDPASVCAMAFGPGLTVECALMELHPSLSDLPAIKETVHATG